MRSFKGKSVFSGVAVGEIYFFKRDKHVIEKRTISDTKGEIARLLEAVDKAKTELSRLHKKMEAEIGADEADIMEVHLMLLEDEDYMDMISEAIENEKVNAEYAVEKAGEHFAGIFSRMEDAYMKERSADIRDITRRLLDVLLGRGEESFAFDKPVIIVADDLTPSETVTLPKDKVLGFVTQKGSLLSHTAILARTLGIPAIVAAGDALGEDCDKKEGIIDGGRAIFYVEPDEKTRMSYLKEQKEEQQTKQELKSLIGKETSTKSGRVVKLFANIGKPEEASLVNENDAEGVGLFRSEFLYLESDHYPTEEEQFKAYKQVLSTLKGKQVVIRTLDIGADKQIDYFNLPKEENPALGMRAIRICLTRPELFIKQLRALLRASVYGKLAIMFPMIISVSEVRRIKEIVEKVKADLSAEGIDYDKEVELGIMIETPAAAVISDLLAPEVDFFSVGTNDLTQYVTAIDRQNESLDEFLDTHHEAVLRLIERSAKNAHAAGIWIGICGELGADQSLTKRFLDMGIDELSVAPASVLPLRKHITELA